jgi:dihydrofolate synthase/folylpolyglutamate synthase
MTFLDVLAHLEALQMHKIKLGLEAMENFLARVDHPERKLSCVHVAGTNGKGSVCSALAEILTLAGYRAGLYTSPHLSSVRERFRIGGEYISEAAFAALGERICRVLGGEQITYFEFTTALGLLWFAESAVDVVLLETGMGGRLDATNVVTPLISVITSVSMDHEAYLGATLEEIAGEKAGIIKRGVPVVSGAIHPQAARVISRTAQERQAPLFAFREDFDYTLAEDGSWDWQGGAALCNNSYRQLRSSHQSLIQPDNDSLAVAAIELLRQLGFAVGEEHLRQGLAQVRWPGRMEYFEVDGKEGGGRKFRYLLDGAHNPDGVKNLANTLEKKFPRRRLIALWGSMVDKDLAATLSTIAPLVDAFVFTRPAGERAAGPEQLQGFLPQSWKGKTICSADIVSALGQAQEEAAEEDLIVVAGSLYLLGEVRKHLLGELAR